MPQPVFLPSSPRPLLAACALGAAAAQAAEPPAPPPLTEAVLAVISSNTGTGHPSSGIDINTLVGADRFYNAGYSGTRAIQANIEAQHIWNGHETLTQATTQVTGTGGIGGFGSHATRVGQTMGGDPLGSIQKSGIAPDAALWSGAIATSVSGNSFNITDASTASVYSAILKTGVGGQTADVFNSSWGGTDPTGYNSITLGIDGLLYQTGKIGVVATGNTGPSANTVNSPAAGYNGIAVAALGADTDATPYNQASSFSSRGPNSYYNPNNGQTVASARARVDIAAPGQNLTLANTGTPTTYSANQAGTSFAAPIVAGGAALVVDAGKALYAGNAKAIDGRVVKAVLLNGADKTQGWSNGQSTVGGVIKTTQSLDYATGAGRMDLDNTFDQYVDQARGGAAGTADVAGTGCVAAGACDMGTVAATGWDYAWANQNGSDAYYIGQKLEGGKNFTATLDWYADINPGANADFAGAAYKHLANLDLTIFEYDPLSRAVLGAVAQSLSLYNTVEHLSFLLPHDGYYGLQVANTGDLWNFSGATGEYFGLAWTSTGIVPAPATWLLVLAGLGGACRARAGRGRAI